MNLKKLKNIYYLSQSLIVISITFFAPILYVFLYNSGYNNTELGLYLSVFWLVSAMFEVPFGMLTDKYGTKKTLIISSFLKFIGMTIIAISPKNFSLLLCSGILTGLGESGFSGCLSSWLVNTYKKIVHNNSYQDNLQQDFQKIFANANILSSFFSMIVGLLSGQFLFNINKGLPIIVSAISFFCLFLFFLIIFPNDFKVKIKEHKKSNEAYSLKKFITLIQSNKILLIIFLYLSIPSIIDVGPGNQWSKAFEGLNFSGYIWALISFTIIASNFLLSKVKTFKLNSKSVPFFLSVDVLLIILIRLSNSKLHLSLFLFLLHVFIYSLVCTLNSAFLHSKIITNDNKRNTMISSYNLYNSIIVAVFLSVLGIFSDIYGIFNSWVIFGIIGILILFIIKTLFRDCLKKYY